MKQWLFDIPLDVLDSPQALAASRKLLLSEHSHVLSFINAHCFNVSRHNLPYKKALIDSDLLLNDGIGISMASWFAGIRLKQNMNGTDFIPQLLTVAAEDNLPVFFLGSKPGVAQKAALEITKIIPHIRVCGFASGYFDADGEREIIQKINDSKAALVVVGMGVPRQELWIANRMQEMLHVRLFVAGGAILDFISGHVLRAPKILRFLHLEWFYRMLLEPRRMARRYLVGNALFLFRVFRLALKKSGN